MSFSLFSFQSDSTNLRKKSISKVLILAITLFFIFIAFRPQTGIARENSGSGVTDPPIAALKIYLVIDGQLQTRILSGKDISGKSFDTEGYVTGLIAVGQPGIKADADGRSISPAAPGADGTFSFGYYGDFTPSSLIESANDRSGLKSIDMSHQKVYSFFPKVPADAISIKSRFYVNIEKGDDLCRLEINQNGGSNIEQASLWEDDDESFPFRYIGTRKNFVECTARDPHNRFAAIAAGIGAVESAFNLDLISGVDILEFNEIHNAVTFPGEDKIWFYINAFENEPVNELRVIAQHEALHILVDRLKLTENRTIRKLFADLKGFDSFSFERFRLVTQGYAPSNARRAKGSNGFFFDFISEKNFIDGMKGGHPEDNLDEFCTSFLHTVMYGNRFETNLKKHNSDQQQVIIDHYAKILDEVADSYSRYASSIQKPVEEINRISEKLDGISVYCEQVQSAN